MPYFLDGNNLIGLASRGTRASAQDRTALIGEIAERLRRTRARAVLFFDGSGERPTSLGSLSIRPSGSRSADDAIVEGIRRSRHPAEIIVVTADRGLGTRARDLGSSVMSPGQFWARVGVGRGESAGFKEGSQSINVEDWMRYFEDEHNRDD